MRTSGGTEGGAGAALPDDFPVTAPALPGRVLFDQRWRDLAFLHWPVDPEAVRRFFPPGCEPDVLGGTTWVSLVPFGMSGAGLGEGRPVPWLGSFLETNVRLYSVDAAGRHGVVFRSLDASRLLVVLAARVGLGLPYTWSRMREQEGAAAREWRSSRRWPGPRGARTSIALTVGPPVVPTPLDVFLTSRWGAHTRVAGRTLWVPNSHEPWPLREAAVTALDDELCAAAGVPVAGPPPLVRFSEGVRTVFGRPQLLPTPALARWRPRRVALGTRT
ncbi:YqjF family protein [Motilibacter peucedani]|uniref:YqjF family protein n=1 Tax=Motilibacter peucedani TaxID=598650 RepID=UPI001E5C38CD|nr:DUF2071 domain-containing protein [Motilibacter peucedani]